ncbi:unnamed protein product [Calicophoron daubneyi]|uniref:Uncharacterized protein n=1 Tax=Calicophoron daubneyi TaxID=300641 RepID=A0AAV2TVX8_CALDB
MVIKRYYEGPLKESRCCSLRPFTMSGQPSSRHRKQRFPRLDRRKLLGTGAQGSTSDDDFLSDEDSGGLPKRARIIPMNKPFRPIKPPIDSKDASMSNCRIDKRARDEHNEQERSRRRELAVIYELIRCSFSEEDLRYLGPCNGPKSIDKLSYPQVLQVAYHLLREEHHNLILFERTLNEIKRIEKELVSVGLPVPERPTYPSITENYRKVVQLVDNLLKHDKSARTPDGVYEVTPAERAALGNRQLALLRPRPYGTVLDSSSYPEQVLRGSGGSRRYVRPEGHYPRYSELPSLTPNRRPTWQRVNPKLKRSASEISMDGMESDAFSAALSPLSISMNTGNTSEKYDDGLLTRQQLQYIDDDLLHPELDSDPDVALDLFPQFS